MTVKLGLFVNSRWKGDVDPGRRLAQVLDQIKAARDAGFESIWIPQHVVNGPDRILQTMPLLGRLTAEAAGMRIGTSIMLLPMLNPVLLAEEVATLDWLTGGRMMLGVGLGYMDHEYAAMQTPKAVRVGRFVEAIEVMRKLWTGEAVTHAGRHFPLGNIRAGSVPKQPGGPPILIGAGVDPAIRRAARIGDGWLITFATPLPRLREQMALFRAERAAAGLPPPAEQTLGRDCYVGADMAAALAEAGPPLLAKLDGFDTLSSLRGAERDARARDLLRDRFLVGDEGFVREEMQRYRGDLGVDLFRLRMEWDGLDQDRILKSIARVGRAAAGVR